MYKVLYLDVDTYIITYSLICLKTKEEIKVKISKFELNYTKENIKKDDIVTFDRLYLKRYNEYKGKNIRKIND